MSVRSVLRLYTERTKDRLLCRLTSAISRLLICKLLPDNLGVTQIHITQIVTIGSNVVLLMQEGPLLLNQGGSTCCQAAQGLP